MKQIKIGFLPLYIELYDQVAPKARKDFDEIVKAVKKLLSLHASVIASGVVTTKSEAACMEKLFKKEKVEAVFTFHLAYSPSYLVADLLKRLNKPVFLLDTTQTSTYKNMTEPFLMLNHGIHGVMDLASVLISNGSAFNVLAGHIDDGAFKEKIKTAIKSIAVAKNFKNQRVGITGKPFRMMGDFAVPFPVLKKRIGMTVFDLKEEVVLSMMSKVKPAELKKEIASDRRKYNMKNVPSEVHGEGVRIYLALKSLAKEKKLDAFTMNFLDYKKLTIPFYAIDRLMEDGLGYAGEGDVLTAGLKKLITPFTKEAMFTEFFCPDWKRGYLLMSHMGESDPSFAARNEKATIVAKKGFGSERLTIYHRFKMKPGTLTFVNIGKLPLGRFKLVVGTLKVITEKLHACLDVPQYSVKPEMPLKEFLEKYSLAGGGHHIYVAKGDITDELLSAGAALGMQVVKI